MVAATAAAFNELYSLPVVPGISGTISTLVGALDKCTVSSWCHERAIQSPLQQKQKQKGTQYPGTQSPFSHAMREGRAGMYPVPRCPVYGCQRSSERIQIS